jgi:PAS domain S-box-containing protein
MAAPQATISARLDSESLLDDLGVVAYALDGRGRIAWISEVVQRVFGYTAGELIGQDALVLVAPEDHEVAGTQVGRSLRGETSVTSYEVTGMTKEGSRLFVRVHSVPFVLDGRIAGVKGITVPRLAGRPPGNLHLTPRQRETLELLARGLTTRQIADRLAVSRETARNHIRAVLQGLGAHSRLEAVTSARQQGLV